jgi:hypothetical protein
MSQDVATPIVPPSPNQLLPRLKEIAGAGTGKDQRRGVKRPLEESHTVSVKMDRLNKKVRENKEPIDTRELSGVLYDSRDKFILSELEWKGPVCPEPFATAVKRTPPSMEHLSKFHCQQCRNKIQAIWTRIRPITTFILADDATWGTFVEKTNKNIANKNRTAIIRILKKEAGPGTATAKIFDGLFVSACTPEEMHRLLMTPPPTVVTP